MVDTYLMVSPDTRARIAKIQERFNELGVRDFKVTLNEDNVHNYHKEEVLKAICSAVETYLNGEYTTLEPVGDSNYNGSN